MASDAHEEELRLKSSEADRKSLQWLAGKAKWLVLIVAVVVSCVCDPFDYLTSRICSMTCVAMLLKKSRRTN